VSAELAWVLAAAATCGLACWHARGWLADADARELDRLQAPTRQRELQHACALARDEAFQAGRRYEQARATQAPGSPLHARCARAYRGQAYVWHGGTPPEQGDPRWN
jgi:hypothetical protein